MLQPRIKFLQGNLPTIALRFFLPGFLAPSVEVLRLDAPGFDPGEAPLILSAIFPEDLVVLPFLRPL